ncbi:hypothetical protein CFP56_025354 [Quercus suber]|uniref:Pectinesterase inhibitor domain-containing protein n=1 Tax=Quercus suber TaxID=58331 RepID=A0AAW0K4R1_QUESU
MASPISCLSILIIPLLVTSLFYDVSNADRALLEKVWKKSMDHDFCLSVLLSDPDGLTNILYRLGLVSTCKSLGIISDVNTGEIPNVLEGVTDPNDRSRILDCRTDIHSLYGDMELAYNAAVALLIRVLIYEKRMGACSVDTMGPMKELGREFKES